MATPEPLLLCSVYTPGNPLGLLLSVPSAAAAPPLLTDVADESSKAVTETESRRRCCSLRLFCFGNDGAAAEA